MLATLTAHLVLAFAVCAAPTSVTGDASTWRQVIDPYVVTSDSGVCTLDVDPLEPRADRPCRVTLRFRGIERWTAEFPCVWRDAAVADDGTCVGHGIVTEPREPEAPLHATSRLWVLAPDGAPRMAQAWKHEPSKKYGLDPLPRVLGLALDDTNDRVLVRTFSVSKAFEHESWGCLSLSGGEWSSRATVAARAKTVYAMPDRSVVAAVRGTPRFLRQRARSQERDLESFELLDDQGRAAWSIERRPTGTGSTFPLEIVRCIDVGRFDVAFYGDAQVQRFEVVPDASAELGWRVVELPSAPREARSGFPFIEAAEVEIVHRARVQYDAPLSDHGFGTNAEGRVNDGAWVSSAFDAAGRLYLTDRNARCIDVFEHDGTRSSKLAVPRPLVQSAVPWIATSSTGRVFVGSGRYTSTGDWCEIDTRATVDGPAFAIDTRARWWSFPDAGETFWHLQESNLVATITRTRADGREIARATRSLDRSWLRFSATIDAMPDGGVVVANPEGIHGFRVDGSPRAFVPLPAFRDPVEASARRIAVASLGRVFLIDLDGDDTRLRGTCLPADMNLIRARALPLDDGTVRLFLPVTRELVTLRLRD